MLLEYYVRVNIGLDKFDCVHSPSGVRDTQTTGCMFELQLQLCDVEINGVHYLTCVCRRCHCRHVWLWQTCLSATSCFSTAFKGPAVGLAC